MTTPTAADLTALRVEALELLGWTQVRETICKGLFTGYAPGDEGRGVSVQEPPDPTINIADAWQLIDVLKAEGWFCSLGNFSEGWDCTFTKFIGDGEDLDTVDHSATADNPALAITRAFVEVRKGR